MIWPYILRKYFLRGISPQVYKNDLSDLDIMNENNRIILFLVGFTNANLAFEQSLFWHSTKLQLTGQF